MGRSIDSAGPLFDVRGVWRGGGGPHTMKRDVSQRLFELFGHSAVDYEIVAAILVSIMSAVASLFVDIPVLNGRNCVVMRRSGEQRAEPERLQFGGGRMNTIRR